MVEYVELEFPNGDLFKGDLLDSQTIDGYGFFFRPKKFLLLARFKEGIPSGSAILASLTDFSVFKG